MPILKEDDKSPWEQYHIVLLSHIAMYWIWSILDPDERLLVTGVSPPIFASQHCFRFRNRMQRNMDGLRLNTLYNKLPFLFQNLDSQALNTKWCESTGFDSFDWSIIVGMLTRRKFEKLFKTEKWKHKRRWKGNWWTSHFQEWKISLRVETDKGIKDLSLNWWILESLKNLGESLSLR